MDISLYYFHYLAFSGAFIGVLFLLAIFLEKKTKIKVEQGRKIIHILFSNWYFIPFFMVSRKEHVLMAMVPPLIFLVLNFLSYRFKLIKIIERENKHDFGTLYYPLAIMVTLFVVNYVLEKPYLGLVSILILGYGDGLAGIIGRHFNEDTSHKSKFGFITMFIVSTIIAIPFVLIYQDIKYLYFAVIIGISAALLEYFPKHGLDNLSIPFGVLSIYYILITLI